jgi:hypothetical protein
MTSSNTQKHFQWALESGAVLIGVGVGLNILVMQTLGSFDAASVILALFLGFWAFVLGNSVLFFSSIWLFMRKREMSAESATVQAVREKQPILLQPVRHTQPCRAC